MKKVKMENADRCPYCKKKMKPNEGSSEMSNYGRAKIWCAYCGKVYYYLEKGYPFPKKRVAVKRKRRR